MTDQKTYAPVSAKQITFQSGKTIIKLGVPVEKFIAFLQEHQNSKGYVNLGISPRKETGKYGETHTVWLDTWQPGEKPAQSQGQAQDAPPRTTTTPPAAPKSPIAEDDVPF